MATVVEILEKIGAKLTETANREFAEACERSAKVVKTMEKLKGSGFPCPEKLDEYSFSWYSPFQTIDVNSPADLLKAKRLFGALIKNGVEPCDPNDMRKKEVYVTLRPKDETYSMLKFRYKRKLNKSDRCKLVKEKPSKGRVYVQCDI